ncbi:hypothetical protein Bca52824_061259 [Brassica carinata]|uniref:Uncharacterized protein n=1 Tax=Brassica carinata TaxID=52824 RepID=A0A8X7QXI7_BRACI|nr:hypothetical protein Bca52824_061259 [Brassica carinata]
MSKKRIGMVEKSNNKRQRVNLVPEFSINDHHDVLVEILRRLDGPSSMLSRLRVPALVGRGSQRLNMGRALFPTSVPTTFTFHTLRCIGSRWLPTSLLPLHPSLPRTTP